MSDRQRLDPVDRLHGFVSGFHATYYVYTGVETGLLEALVRPGTPAELAADLDLHSPCVHRFCEVGLRWGLLDVEPPAGDETGGPHRFHLAEAFVEPLGRPDSHRYMGEYFRVLGAYLGTDYGAYPDTFATGTQRPPTDRGPEFTDAIEGSIRGLASVFVVKLLRELTAFESELVRGGPVLDIGCGTGHLACRLTNRYPDLEIVGVDVDGDAIDRARERAERADVADRTTFRVQDAVDVEGSFEAAILFMSLHEIDPGTRESLFERLGELLGDDGVVTVLDHVYPGTLDQFDRAPFAAGAETQWAELAWGSDVPTRSEQRSLLAAAGCAEQNRQTFDDRFEVYEGVSR